MIDYSELREHFDKKIPIIMSVGGAVVFINDVAQISSPITFLGISFTKLSTDDITFVLVIVMLYSAIGLMINLSYYKSIGLYKSATSQVESITEDTKNPPDVPKYLLFQKSVYKQIATGADYDLVASNRRFIFWHAVLPLLFTIIILVAYFGIWISVLGQVVSKILSHILG